jgi:aubergine-like protein
VSSRGGEVVIMIVKFIRDFPSVDEVAQSQVFGVLIRRALKMGGMKLIGRNYFNMNPEVMKSLPEHRLQVAPGLITGIRQHETQLMMNLFIHSKVMRSETCLDQLKFLRMNGMKDFQDKARLLLVGQVVLTRYNNKTYSIDDVDFSKNPKNAWSEGMEETFEEYYLYVSFNFEGHLQRKISMLYSTMFV